MSNKISPPRIGFVSLGCPKATVDSEHILTRLRAEGYLISGSYQDADLVVVNTCGFINSAVEESLDAIGEALAENGKVIVTGCLGAKGDVVKQAHPSGINFELADGHLLAKRGDSPELAKFHGLARSLVANAVAGVTEGFKRELDIVGVGYRAEVKGKQVIFAWFENKKAALAWYYSDAPHMVRPRLDLARRTSTFDEVVRGLDETNALFEARRCLSCGNCFECDNCYGVCPDNAVIKLGPGKRFEFNYDYCKGCGICEAECPCGAIAMAPETI